MGNECLLHKHDNLYLDLRCPHKKPGMMYVHNLSASGGRDRKIAGLC